MRSAATQDTLFAFRCALLFALLAAVAFDRAQSHATTFWPFQDLAHREFGLVDEEGRLCLQFRFGLQLYNLNLNGTDLEQENVAMADASRVRLSGFCALWNEVRKQAQLRAQWRATDRRLQLILEFREAIVQSPHSASQQIDELRWSLDRIEYHESYRGRSVYFTSANSSSASGASVSSAKTSSFISGSGKRATPNAAAVPSDELISAPLNQKFVCADKINVTLSNPKFRPVVIEFEPDIDLEPMNGAGRGFGSNVYTCERTRRRTLRESFQSRTTVAASVMLGASSVGTIIGYSVWLHAQSMKKRDAAHADAFYSTF